MPTHIRLCLCAILLSILLAPPAAGQLKSLETEDLRLVYIDPTQTYMAPYAARCFENSMRFQREIWGYTPWEPVTVLLADSSDQGNASAGNSPRNTLIVQTAPLSLAYETVTPNERMNWIMNHELVHIATGDQAAGSDRVFRKLFHGKVAPDQDHPETIYYFYLTTPRYAAPQWFREGIAVFVETWMAGGFGRAQGPWDEMVFRSMVRDETRFYDPLGLVSEGVKADFQAGVNYYLYGTRFMSYLAHEYSPEKLISWVSRTKGSKRYYSRQFKQVFDRPLKEVWREWVAWEQEFQQRNLEAIREYPTTPYEDLSPKAVGSVSRAYYDPDTRKIYAAFNYPGVVAHVGAISVDDGSVERLVDVKGPTLYTVTSLAYDPDDKMIFYTTDNVSYRDLRSLDPETKKTRMLIRDVRIGHLAFNRADRSLWGVRHLNGIASLVQVPHPYSEWKQIKSWPYGDVIYDVDVSPDGKLLSLSEGGVDGRHRLQVLEIDRLMTGDSTPLAEQEFESTLPQGFTFSADGRYLYGSSYYTGVSNIFRYEVASGDLEALSNCETGFFRPIPQDDGSLIVFRYTGDGFVPARIEATPLEDVNPIIFLGQQIAEKHPVVTEWGVGSPAEVPLEEMITREGDYQSRKIGLESVYPIVEGFKDFAAWGLHMDLSDPISMNRFGLTASYTTNSGLPSDERLHLELDYHHRNFGVGFKLNDADFYDLFGPTKRSRKGYVLSTEWDKSLIADEPRLLDLNVSAAHYGDLERLPRYQNVPATFDKLSEAGIQLTYNNRNLSIGAVDYEKGIKAEALVGTSYVDDDLIPAAVINFDYGVALPLHNSSVWFRTSVGAAFGEEADPFANFFFGGFGNNYVDYRSTKRYREFYAFPGVELNAIGGRNYAKSIIEWNLPPLRFTRVGSPGFYLTWARASLFASGIKTNLDSSLAVEREVTNVGAQIDFRITLLSRLNFTASIGYAKAFESGLPDDDEFMFSLKVLH